MNRLPILVFLALSACHSGQPAEQYGYLALLGNDTVSVERDSRQGNEIVSDEVDRFPRVRRRHTTIRLADNGTIAHLEMDITTPSEPSNERERHVVADVSHDSVHITKYDSTGTKKYAFATGGALSRTNIYTSLDGEGCGATLNGLYMADDEQHVDHQTNIVHAQPNCFSREIYKGILSGSAHGVFNGKVYVHPIAQKTDGKQTNNNLLLSERARIDTKPQLEIYADDVRCTHGATVGRLDEMALFYMKSRGVSADKARRLLTYAFAADVLETIEVEAVRAELERATLERFTGASVAA